MKVKSPSRVQLFATLWTVGHQAPLSMGFSRQEYWSGFPFSSSRDLPNLGIKLRSPALHADSSPRGWLNQLWSTYNMEKLMKWYNRLIYRTSWMTRLCEKQKPISIDYGLFDSTYATSFKWQNYRNKKIDYWLLRIKDGLGTEHKWFDYETPTWGAFARKGIVCILTLSMSIFWL